MPTDEQLLARRAFLRRPKQKCILSPKMIRDNIMKTFFVKCLGGNREAITRLRRVIIMSKQVCPEDAIAIFTYYREKVLTDDYQRMNFNSCLFRSVN